MKLKTEQITIAGVLGAITVVLGTTGLGFIPVATPAGAATLMHLPVVLAGILGGPVVGAAVGLIFGLTTLRFMGDLRVVIPARLLMGPMAFWVYSGLRRRTWGLPLAAAVGSLANTAGTLALAVLFGYIPLAGKTGALAIAIMQGGPEALVAAVLLTPIVLAVTRAMHRA
ncbi:MAG TPA: ECF transporter S component [Firmicutes bacterium]|nr:ECF transporter S component [Bacillota bacterium]